MRVVIAGGSGFIGTALTEALIRVGHDVVVISRTRRHTEGAASAGWDDDLVASFDGAEAVVNLAGANIGAHRWTSSYRREILDSRVNATRTIVDALVRCVRPPALVNVSAVGFYGDTSIPGDESQPAGATFLADVCRLWEAEAERAGAVTRVALLRLGLVLDREEGALPRMAGPMKFFIGGPLGPGNQWMPWVHREDVVRAFLWAIASPHVHGPYNITAPGIVRMKEFSKALGTALHRPSWLPVPSIVLRIVLGLQADLVIHGQYAHPMRTEMDGFRFRHPYLAEALASL